MSGIDLLMTLAGAWSGPNRLWLRPTEPPQLSQSNASVIPVLAGRYARIDYTWAYRGEPQEGSLLFGYETEAKAVTGVWIDSWHMGDKLMVCHGVAEAGGAINVRGSYAVSSGRDWGWRIVISPGDERSFRIVMYNVPPEGNEELAVETIYTKAPSSGA